MRPGAIVIHVTEQQVAEVALAEHNNVVKAFPSDRTEQPSAYPFCQGARGDVGRSRMPIDRSLPSPICLDRTLFERFDSGRPAFFRFRCAIRSKARAITGEHHCETQEIEQRNQSGKIGGGPSSILARRSSSYWRGSIHSRISLLFDKGSRLNRRSDR
jgi:hypothetical protein